MQIDYRQTLWLGELISNLYLQIQNRAAKRMNCHYRNRSVGMSTEISHYRYRFSLESDYYGAQNDYTHIFIIWELISNYTGHLLHMAFLQEFFCVIRAPMKVLSVNVPIAHINCLGMNFPITHTSVTQKNCFRIICVIISGLIVISFTDTNFGLKTNYFCNHLGYNGIFVESGHGEDCKTQQKANPNIDISSARKHNSVALKLSQNAHEVAQGELPLRPLWDTRTESPKGP